LAKPCSRLCRWEARCWRWRASQGHRDSQARCFSCAAEAGACSARRQYESARPRRRLFPARWADPFAAAVDAHSRAGRLSQSLGAHVDPGPWQRYPGARRQLCRALALAARSGDGPRGAAARPSDRRRVGGAHLHRTDDALARRRHGRASSRAARPYRPLASLLFVYNAALYWGFLNCLFGMGIGLLLFAAWIATRSWSNAVRLPLFAL